MTSDRPTVVYIASYGHSGSTLLDLLISSHSDVVSVGEIVMLHREGEPSACTCGAPSPWLCEFWQRVDDRLASASGLRLAGLEVADGDHPDFETHNGALFEAVRLETGCSVIVDSSKQRDRLRGLLRCRTIDLRVILLTRDPRGVVYSYLRTGRPLVLHAARRARRMVLMRRALAGVPYTPLKYELLASQPSQVLATVMQSLRLSLQPEQLQFGGRTRHNLGGNRMRFDRDSTIAVDLAWQQGLSVWQKVVIRVVSAVAGLALVNVAIDRLKQASRGDRPPGSPT
jgi:hypothetical protein